MSCKYETEACKNNVHCSTCDHYTELEGINDTNNQAEWVMVIDDFDNGQGNRPYPHCSNCHRGVYTHDAGKYCPFCGTPMKNPMVTVI